MSWVYESRRLPSAVNGEIRCTRWFGRWEVVVAGTGQASAYLDEMWRKALRRAIPREANIKRILVLGMGTGRAFREMYRRFPKAHIVTIEIDPIMVELAKSFGILSRQPRPEVHVGRAEDVAPKLQGQFDLIISDMFVGDDVASDTASPALQKELLRLLDPNGHLICNAYHQTAFFDGFTPHLAVAGRWKFRLNWLGHFRPHGAGVLGDAFPPGHIPYFGSVDYLRRHAQGARFYDLIQAGKAAGIRQTFGSVALERYHSEHAPEPTPVPLHRFIIWDRWNPGPPPPGWRTLSILPPRRRLTGYVELPPTGDFHHAWSTLALRENKKWLAQDTGTIRNISVDAYCNAYAHSKKRPSLVKIFSEAVRHKAATQGDLLHLYGAVAHGTGEIIAGLAILDIPEISASLHVTGFVLPQAQGTGAGTGLIHHWFSETQTRGLRFCDFDGFYAPGDPKSWQGFSRFKSQFGTRYIAYPKPLWRFIKKQNPA
jgi:SAM-dependent methyltransferase